MQNIWLPLAFFFSLLAVIGLSIWLATVFMRRNNQDKPDVSPVVDAADFSRRIGASDGKDFLQVRLNPQGIWEVLVGGVRYTNLNAVPDKETRDQVVDAVRILAAFSRDYIQKQRKTPAPHVDAQPDAVSSGRVVPPPVSASSEPELRRPSTPPMWMPEINLAKEIGDILDELKARSPSLSSRDVRLQNAPNGGVAFIVDGALYNAVEEIPDLEVQALIRSATKEWERR